LNPPPLNAFRQHGAELAEGTTDLFNRQVVALNDSEAHAFELGSHVLGVVGRVAQGG